MEPGKESASPSRSSLWPLALLGILVSTLTLFTSKRNQPSESVHAQDTTKQKSASPPKEPAIISDIPISPSTNQDTKGSENGTPLWKKVLEYTAIFVALGLLVVNIFQMRATKKAAKAAETANVNARNALIESEQAIVTVGRADGTVADIVTPKLCIDSGLV